MLGETVREQRGGQGWVEHTPVIFKGSFIGTIQKRSDRGPGGQFVESTMTIGPNGSKPGIQVRWLIDQLELDKWVGGTFPAPAHRARPATATARAA